MAHNVTLEFQQDKSPGWEERLRSTVDELTSEVLRLQAELKHERKKIEPLQVVAEPGRLIYALEDGYSVVFLGRAPNGVTTTDEALRRVQRPELDRLLATLQYLTERTARMVAAEKRRPDSDGVIGTVK